MKLNVLCFFRSLNRNTITKTLLIMKLTAIILVAASLQVSATGYSQTVTLSLKNVKLQKVFKEINRQTGYQFFYKDALLDEAGKVDIDVKNIPLEQVLVQCFNNLPITYNIVDRTIVVKEKGAEPNEVGVNDPPPLIKVTGTVLNEKGEVVVGASVIIKGTQKGTTTDANGYFELADVNENATLVITSVNIETVEIKLNGRTSLAITAKIKTSTIDEVQIIGYGTTTKRLNTGAVSTVKGYEIKDRPVSNVLQALQGKVPGLSITNFSPGIGSPVQLQIRGVNSITSGTNPLIIIDGVIINSDPGGLITMDPNGSGPGMYQQGNSVMNNINPDDVESVEILKDADATAIYGSRGTNGVILINTKKATLGKAKVSINASTGWKSAVGITKRMNTQQYLKMRNDAFAVGTASATSAINPITKTTRNAPDLLVWDQNKYTDYPDMIINNPAPSYNVNATISGGTKAMNVLASMGYFKIYDNIMFKPYQERITGRLQINHTSQNNKLKLYIRIDGSKENQKFTQITLSTVQAGGVANVPNYDLYKSDGTYYYPSGYLPGSYYNPLPNQNISMKSVTNNILMTGELSYEFIKGLVAKMQVNYGSQANAFHQLYPTAAINPQNQYDRFPYGIHTFNTYTSLNIEPQISYNKRISKANIVALAGLTFLDRKTEASSIKVNNPGSDDLLYSYSSGQPTTTYSNNTPERFESIFGRITSDWDGKYIANLSFRRDGSSRFGTANRFANFGSIGGAWIFSSESFIKDNLTFLKFGKLRASYGITGNHNIPNFQYVSLLQAGDGSYTYDGGSLLNPAAVGNKKIQWENTRKLDIGIETLFFKNRFGVSFTWFRSLSDNLLADLPLPGQTGFTTYTGNFPAQVQNTGQEIEISSQNLSPQSKVQWTSKLNITHVTNILKSFPNLKNSAYATKYEIGRAIPSSDVLKQLIEMPMQFTGINTANGLPQFTDVNKDNVINYQDQLVNGSWWGSSSPTLFGGLNNNVSYKGLSLDVFLQFSNGIFTKWNYYGSANGTMNNPSVDVVDNYWMQPGDNKKYPRLYTGVAGSNTYIAPLTQQYGYSTATLYKGYYIRLKNVQITYTLPAQILSKAKIANASLYISGENLAVYTPVKLQKDPEIYWSSNAGLLRTITIGFRMNF